jgi:hypothetical protein
VVVLHGAPPGLSGPMMESKNFEVRATEYEVEAVVKAIAFLIVVIV